MSERSEILEVIKTMPGLTQGEIRELCPHIGNVSSRIAALMNLGSVRREDKKYYEGTGKPPIPHKLRMKTPSLTPSQTEASLKAQVIELQLWKTEAIKRYSDLGVSPELKAAREAAIAFYKRTGDNQKISDIRAGKLDETPLIQVALLAAIS